MTFDAHDDSYSRKCIDMDLRILWGGGGEAIHRQQLDTVTSLPRAIKRVIKFLDVT